MNRFYRYLNYRSASILLFGVSLCAILLTFRRYGIGWDEHLQIEYGNLLLKYYLGLLSGNPDLSVNSYANLYLYGGFYDLLATAAVRLSPFGLIATRHLVNALTGWLGLIGVWKLSHDLFGERAAFWSALLATMIPGYYGQMFINPKDIPFAVGYIWSLVCILRVIQEYPQLRWPTLIKTGVIIGLSMGIRIGGVMLLGYLALGLLLSASDKPRYIQKIYSWAAVALIAYVMMLIFWPWAQQNPLSNPLAALLQQTQFNWIDTVRYRGVDVLSSELPWDYLPRYFLITLPESIIVLLGAGLFIGLVGLRKFNDREHRNKKLRLALLITAIVFPIVYAVLTHPVLYDGMRHFLFVLLPLACLAGISFDRLIGSIPTNRASWSIAVNLILAFALLSQLRDAARLFPYEYSYFNHLAGGLRGAYQEYDLDYWGLSTSEAARELVAYLKENDLLKGHSYQVFTCADPFSASYYFPEQLSISKQPKKSDFIIGHPRWNCDSRFDDPIILSIQREGVPLAVVRRVTQP